MGVVLNPDGSVTIRERADLAYNRNPPAGSLRGIAGLAWLMAIQFEDEKRCAVHCSVADPFRYRIIVTLDRLFVLRAADIEEAIDQHIARMLPMGAVAYVRVIENWRATALLWFGREL